MGCSRATTGPPWCDDPGRIDALIATEVAAHPVFGEADLFKLLQQATMGAEHAVPDAASAREWMRQEWSTLGSGPTVPLVEPLGESGEFVRVNLRPWRDRGGDPDSLTLRFLGAARSGVPDTSQLECAVDRLAALAAARIVPFDPDSLTAEITAWRAAGFPAMHHSTDYERRYRPAYRVIARSAVAGLLRTLPDGAEAIP